MRGFLHVFRKLLSPIPDPSPCPSSPASREPISVAITIDLQRKRRVMTQKVNVSQGKQKVDKLRTSRLWCYGIVNGKNKRDEEAKKKQRKEFKATLVDGV
ncbi:hypothetical protein [Absidia glauca]|uniref:Uncharacterized protein n=1 Tax=Absidia glauca TaxID=4829 RepID=A0A168KYV5_ABSGL|nr:hypothetical protein [Absidia glauca]